MIGLQCDNLSLISMWWIVILAWVEVGKRGKETNSGPWNETTSLIVDRRLSVRQTRSIWPEWQCVMGHFLLACECFCILVATSAKIWARSAGTCETTKTFCSSCISRRCCCCCWWRWLWLWSWLLLVAVVLVAFLSNFGGVGTPQKLRGLRHRRQAASDFHVGLENGCQFL